jgi:hypothetical protein
VYGFLSIGSRTPPVTCDLEDAASALASRFCATRPDTNPRPGSAVSPPTIPVGFCLRAAAASACCSLSFATESAAPIRSAWFAPIGLTMSPAAVMTCGRSPRITLARGASASRICLRISATSRRNALISGPGVPRSSLIRSVRFAACSLRSFRPCTVSSVPCTAFSADVPFLRIR